MIKGIDKKEEEEELEIFAMAGYITELIKSDFQTTPRFEATSDCFDSVTFSTCAPGDAFDTAIQIWDDADCAGGNPTCVAGNDDLCGVHSLVQLTGDDLSRRLYVFVTGFATNVGQFNLAVDCE